MRASTIKFLEYTGENLNDFGLGKDFFSKTQKAGTIFVIDKLDSIKNIKILLFKKPFLQKYLQNLHLSKVHKKCLQFNNKTNRQNI